MTWCGIFHIPTVTTRTSIKRGYKTNLRLNVIKFNWQGSKIALLVIIRTHLQIKLLINKIKQIFNVYHIFLIQICLKIWNCSNGRLSSHQVLHEILGLKFPWIIWMKSKGRQRQLPFRLLNVMVVDCVFAAFPMKIPP